MKNDKLTLNGTFTLQSLSDLKTKINSGKFILQFDSINSLQNNKPFPKLFFKSPEKLAWRLSLWNLRVRMRDQQQQIWSRQHLHPKQKEKWVGWLISSLIVTMSFIWPWCPENSLTIFLVSMSRTAMEKSSKASPRMPLGRQMHKF